MKTKSIPLSLSQVRALQAARIDRRETERARVEEEERRRLMEVQEDRRRIIQSLQDRARQLQEETQLPVTAVLPEDTDPLETMDPTPESDLDFPISAAQWDLTWHIESILAYSFDVYVTDDEDDE